tara:strand:- start:1759 stop:2337 length:579 start_codon:yes stop_codon:yes gene_type:complete
MPKDKSVFEKLNSIDVSNFTEKKGRFTYLSWAWAVRELLKVAPTAQWKIHQWGLEGNEKPYMQTKAGCFVQVTLTIDDISRTQVHPVLNHKNQSIEEPNAFEINTSIQRCLAKAIALHGLGLYIFAGEDLPTPPKPLTKEEIDELLANAKAISIEQHDRIKNLIKDETINRTNYKASMAKLKRELDNIKKEK